MIKKIICFFALIVLTFSFSFCDEAKEKSKIKITADNTSIPWGEKDKNVVLKGNVSVVYETTKLMSAYVIFNQDTKVAVSPGKVTVNAKETNFTADSGSSDFKNKICKASGNINGFIKKEVSDTIENNKKKENVKKEITENILFKCDNAEYNYKTKILNATGNIRISEKDRVITCEKLRYDGNKEIFYLNGNVKGEDKEGQTFVSQGEVVVSVKDGNEYINAPSVESVFYVDIDEE